MTASRSALPFSIPFASENRMVPPAGVAREAWVVAGDFGAAVEHGAKELLRRREAHDVAPENDLPHALRLRFRFAGMTLHGEPGIDVGVGYRDP